MNVMEDARNLVKSNGGGIGVGSRRPISNDVHGSSADSGSFPRRAKSYIDVQYKGPGEFTAECYWPDPSCPSNRNPSIDLKPRALAATARWKERTPTSRRDEGLLSNREKTVESCGVLLG